MSSPTINYRIAEFLGGYLPFKLIDSERIRQLSSHIIIGFHAKDEDIFIQHEDHIAIVKEGVVKLSREDSNGTNVYDMASEGDIVGTWRLHPDKPEGYSAICTEDSLIYYLPSELMEEEIISNPKLALYFTSGISSVGKARQQFDSSRLQHSLEEQFYHLYRLADIDHPRGEALVTISPDKSIRDAAQYMTDHSVSSIIVVDEQMHPMGMVTDRDMRTKVATGQYPLEAGINEIMSRPVITVGEKSSLTEVHIMMVRKNIHHLCVTRDGTDNSPVTGIITDTNLLLQKGNNPVLIVSRIKKTSDIADLKTMRDQADELVNQYLEKEVAIPYISKIITEINDAIIRKCIQINLKDLNPDNFTWISLGSEGRSEQLIRTDQDNALIYANSDEKDLYLELGEKVTEMLNEIGFEYCPAEMMASNPRWNMSLDEWKETFGQWIRTPTPDKILHSTIFFDLRSIYGNHKMGAELNNHIGLEIRNNNLFLNYLAGNALQNPPPLSLFRNFVLEKSGSNEDKFDIKSRALMPLVDASRVLSFQHGTFDETNTHDRFLLLAEKEPKYKSLFVSAADAYEWLLRLRALSSFRHQDSGRYIDIQELNKWQRKNLKQSFYIIGEIQKIIRTRFQLDYLRS